MMAQCFYEPQQEKQRGNHMKAKSIHKLRELMTVKHACLLILLAVLMTPSLTVFAGSCPPNGQKKSKGRQPPQAISVANTPTAMANGVTPQAKNTGQNAVKLSTVVVVFNPANSPATPPPQMTTEQQALTTPKGSPLYYYDPDTDPKKPSCLKTLILAANETCTAAWPPLLQSDGSSLTIPELSQKLTATQNDNGLQITFNGHLLYTYSKDQMPLIAIGDGGKSGPWHIAIPSTPVLQPSEQPTTTPDVPVGQKPTEQPTATPDVPVGQKPAAIPDIPVGQKPT
jgi:predicted lipoprotein with Yx(FWY)xxD motif